MSFGWNSPEVSLLGCCCERVVVTWLHLKTSQGKSLRGFFVPRWKIWILFRSEILLLHLCSFLSPYPQTAENARNQNHKPIRAGNTVDGNIEKPASAESQIGKSAINQNISVCRSLLTKIYQEGYTVIWPSSDSTIWTLDPKCERELLRRRTQPGDQNQGKPNYPLHLSMSLACKFMSTVRIVKKKVCVHCGLNWMANVTEHCTVTHCTVYSQIF